MENSTVALIFFLSLALVYAVMVINKAAEKIDMLESNLDEIEAENEKQDNSIAAALYRIRRNRDEVENKYATVWSAPLRYSAYPYSWRRYRHHRDHHTTTA